MSISPFPLNSDLNIALYNVWTATTAITTVTGGTFNQLSANTINANTINTNLINLSGTNLSSYLTGTTATNIGGNYGLYAGKSASGYLQFQSLSAGTNVSITSDGLSTTINSGYITSIWKTGKYSSSLVASLGTNTNNGYFSTIAGGINNYVKGTRSFIGGGLNNYAGGNYSTFVGTGHANTASTNYSAVITGKQNLALNYGVIGSGTMNTAYTSCFIATGKGNKAVSYSLIGTGIYNSIVAGAYNAIINGVQNGIGSTSTLTSIGNGKQNGIAGTSIYASIINGSGNSMYNVINCTISNGQNNIITNATGSTITGGVNYTLTDSYTTMTPKLRIGNLPSTTGQLYGLVCDTNGNIFKQLLV